MRFETGILSESFRLTIGSRMLILAISIALFGFNIFQIKILQDESMSDEEFFVIFGTIAIIGPVLTAGLLAALAYRVYSGILLPGNGRNNRGVSRQFGFTVRYIVLTSLAVGTSMVLSIFIMASFSFYAVPEFTDWAIRSAVAWGFFAMFGTLLPAYLTGRNRGFRAAFARGKRHFSWIGTRLAAVFLFTSTANWAAIMIFGDVAEAIAYGANPDKTAVAGYLLINTVTVWSTTIPESVILLRAYLRDQDTRTEIFA